MDINNEREGKDTGIMRTTRLFYVACARAEKSLAVVAYTENKEAVKNTAIFEIIIEYYYNAMFNLQL